MPGWLFRVTTKRMDGAPAAGPVVEVYIASIADRLAAWAAVAAEANRTDPLATAEVTGEASDMRLEAEGVPKGGIKLIERAS
jgi:hypothetical protein